MRRTSPGKWWWVYSSSSREISSRRIKYSRRISSSLRWRRSSRRQRCTARWRGYSSRNKTGRWWRAETSRWRAVGSSWSVWRKTKSHWGISFMKSRTVTEDWYPWNLWNVPPPHSIHIVKVAWTHSVWVTFDIFKDLMLQEGRFRWRFRWWWWWQWTDGEHDDDERQEPVRVEDNDLASVRVRGQVERERLKDNMTV